MSDELTDAQLRELRSLRARVAELEQSQRELRQAQHALGESERRFRETADFLSTIISEAAPDGTLLYTNEIGYRSFGYAPEEVRKDGLNVMDLVHPEDRPLALENMSRLLRGESTGRTEYRMVARDGREMNMVLRSALIVRDGEVVGVRTSLSDITDRKKAERALRESEEKFRSVSESMLVALAILQEGRVVYLNQAGADLLDRPAEEVLGMGLDEWIKIVHPDDRQWVRGRVSGLIESREESRARFTYRIVLPSGEVRWVDRQSRTIHHFGKPAYILSMLDVTQIHEAERALQELQQRLISAGEQERRRLARELHDSIGQSLCALRLNLRSALSEQAEGRGASVARLDAMCEELIGEVRSLSHGLYPPALESLGLVSALRRLMRDAEAKVRCVLHFDKGLDRRRFAPEVEIALFRIAQESFSNAMRHSEASVLEIHLGTRGGNVFINILDDGKGFDPQSHSGGIGLSTMRERAKAIGGNVWISSQPGRTCVEAIVPALGTGRAGRASPSDP